jgi:hypothetical protein
MARGKWAEGIKPRNFTWIIQDRLAVCERPGGYGDNHRRVRRQEEIIWIREQGFTSVVSLIAAPHNLHNYDELGVHWRHRPLTTGDDLSHYLGIVYPELEALLDHGELILMHQEELGDTVAGVIGGYLLYSGKLPTPPAAINMIEQITTRQLGPEGRDIIAAADTLKNAD